MEIPAYPLICQVYLSRFLQPLLTTRVGDEQLDLRPFLNGQSGRFIRQRNGVPSLVEHCPVKSHCSCGDWVIFARCFAVCMDAQLYRTAELIPPRAFQQMPLETGDRRARDVNGNVIFR